MICNRITLRDFRNIAEAEVAFCDGVNILMGENAQGKTNLLEAIAYAALGRSFRTLHDEEMIRFGAEMAEVSVDFTDSQRRQNITVRLMKGKRRRIEQNRVKVGRVSDIVGQFRTVLFCPEHLSLIKDGPAERRNFLDVAISQLYPLYLRSLQRYNQILKQRNQLIRNYEDDPKTFRDTVEFWSVQLAHEAALIAQYRYRYLLQAGESVKESFAEMTGGTEVPEVAYDGSSGQAPEAYADVGMTEKIYRELLLTRHEREIGAGTTLWGIHKDDITIRLNGREARLYASQGQQRSLALALKLAEGEVCRKVCGEVPVFLLDDVFSELDRNRRAYLAEKIRGRQVIITSCEPQNAVAGRVIGVKNGAFFPAENPGGPPLTIREENT